MSQGQDPGSIPGASTKNTLAYVRIKTVSGTIRSQCVFDGGEMGSTDLLRVKEITGKERPSICGETHAICPKL